VLELDASVAALFDDDPQALIDTPSTALTRTTAASFISGRCTAASVSFL
jgi:hypothetical protein